MKNLFLTIACISALHSQAQLFTEAGAAFAIPSFRPAITITPGIRMGDVEATTPAMWWPGWATSAGAAISYRLPGSYTQGDRGGFLLGAGIAYTWHHAQAKAEGATNRPGPVVSAKYCLPHGYSVPFVVEARYQAHIVSLTLSIRL